MTCFLAEAGPVVAAGSASILRFRAMAREASASSTVVSLFAPRALEVTVFWLGLGINFSC